MKIREEYKELKMKSKAELQKLLISSREKLRDLRFKISQNQLKNIREYRTLRNKISRTLTLLNKKEETGVITKQNKLNNTK